MLFYFSVLTGIAKYYFEDISASNGILTFDDLVLNRSKTRDIAANISNRRNAYSEEMQSSLTQSVQIGKDGKNNVDTTRCRLCFQVFSIVNVNGCNLIKELCTAFSNVIEDTRSHPPLQITDISDTSSQIQGM